MNKSLLLKKLTSIISMFDLRSIDLDFDMDEFNPLIMAEKYFIGDALVDPNESNIYGWELGQNKEYVYYLANLIKEGTVLPSIPMIPVSRNDYCLYHDNQVNIFCGREDGGHHRVLAYQLANVPIPVRLFSGCEISSQIRYKVGPENMVSNPSALEKYILDSISRMK